ncbi:hypothetical protein [Reyranella sp.]|uniref:hypothetical protein n=1 Tax=Reyranella sp. TaxID=1929291 RepID=UPI003BA90C58
MNRFFLDTRELGFEPPQRAFARFDQSEPVETTEADEALVAFEAVDADWLRHAPAFEPAAPPAFSRRWAAYWRHIAEPTRPPDDPYAETPIFRLETTIGRDRPLFDELAKYGHEPRWKMFERAPDGPYEVDVFGGLFTAPIAARYHVHDVPQPTEALLDIVFDMDTWPDATDDDIENALRSSAAADYLAVYDIGQGSANGLLDGSREPRLYFDLGCGVYRNAHTTPTPLRYCWSADPPIVLSHWDSDHWAGANKDTNALGRTWIAPRQKIGPIHSGFANGILQAGGRILVWGPTGAATITVGGSGRPVSISRCTGSGRNGSGLAVTVEDTHTNQGWLLTGDAGYHELRQPPAANLSAVVVPHHGADMGSRSQPPSPGAAAAYQRLLYSFGDGNRHGKTGVQHPTANAVNVHHAAGWHHGTWQGTAAPGHTVAGHDVVATAAHQAGHLGGVIVGWSAAPNLSAAHCGAVLGTPATCSLSLDQN